MGADECEGYVYTNMCDTGYVRSSCRYSCRACEDEL